MVYMGDHACVRAVVNGFSASHLSCGSVMRDVCVICVWLAMVSASSFHGCPEWALTCVRVVWL